MHKLFSFQVVFERGRSYQIEISSYRSETPGVQTGGLRSEVMRPDRLRIDGYLRRRIGTAGLAPDSNNYRKIPAIDRRRQGEIDLVKARLILRDHVERNNCRGAYPDGNRSRRYTSNAR